MPNACSSSDLPAYSCAAARCLGAPLTSQLKSYGGFDHKAESEKSFFFLSEILKSALIFVREKNHFVMLFSSTEVSEFGETDSFTCVFLARLPSVGVGGRRCSDILLSGARVWGPLGSLQLQPFHK